MSFHGRAPQRIQQAMQAMVPAPRRDMYSADMNPMLGDIQRGYHPTEGAQPKIIRPRQAMPEDPWGPAESWNQIRNDQMTDIGPFADMDMRPLQNINRETSPSTPGNAPVNQGRPMLPQGAIDVESMPPRGANFSPKQMADWLIAQKIETQAGLVGGTLLAAGALGMGVNGMQGDSNGNLIQKPVTQAALLGGAGAYLGHEGVDMYQRQTNRTARGFEQPASAMRGRHRAYGAIAGTAAGALAGLTTQLNDQLQTGMY